MSGKAAGARGGKGVAPSGSDITPCVCKNVRPLFTKDGTRKRVYCVTLITDIAATSAYGSRLNLGRITIGRQREL